MQAIPPNDAYPYTHRNFVSRTFMYHTDVYKTFAESVPQFVTNCRYPYNIAPMHYTDCVSLQLRLALCRLDGTSTRAAKRYGKNKSH